MPIVPLSEENEDAMEDAVFLSFLTKIGLAAPADENVSEPCYEKMCPVLYPKLYLTVVQKSYNCGDAFRIIFVYI